MKEIWTIVLAAGIPSTISSLVIGWFVKRQSERDKAKEQINILMVQGVGASISLGKAVAIAQKNGKVNGDTEKALNYAEDVKHDITNFLTAQGVKHIY